MINQGPNVPKKEGTERWLYELLRRQGLNSQQAIQGINAIGRGEAPDGSGLPLPSLDDYLYKPGRVGGQKAFGGKNASEILIFSSTKSGTKGSIWLTEDGDVIVDEVNKRVGIGETSPDAKLHVKIGASTVTYTCNSDISTYSAGTFGDVGLDKWGTNSDSSGLPSPYSTGYQNVSSSDDYSSYLTADNSTAVSRTCRLGLNGTLATGQTVWDVTLRMTRLFGTAGSGTLYVYVHDSGGNRYGASLDCSTLTGSWADYSLTATSVGTSGFVPNSITLIYSSPGYGGGGNPIAYNVITYITVGTTDSSDILQKWENPSANNVLNYAFDSAGTTTLELSGTPPLRLTTAPEFDVGTPTTKKLWSSIDTEGTGEWRNPSFSSDVFDVHDATDATKKIALDASDIATGTTRTYTFPNYSGQVPAASNTPTNGDVLVVDSGQEQWLSLSSLLPAEGTVTITNADSPYTPPTTMSLVLCDATAGAITVILDAFFGGSIITIKKIDSSSNAVTVDPSGGTLIDGDTTLTISYQNSAAQMQLDGVAWSLI